MTSREQFEAWLRAQPHVLNVGIEPDGTYTLHEDRVAWEAWQASREAMEVELPQEAKCRFKYPEAEAQCDGFNDALSQCDYAIRAAGIKVKGGVK